MTHFIALALSILFLATPVYAADALAQSADWDARRKAAEEKQRRGSQMNAAAIKQFEAEQQACRQRFRVTDCQSESRLRYNQSTKAASTLEAEGATEERQIRKEERDDKDARYAAEAPAREADLRARAAAVASERAAAMAARDKRLSDKAAQAERGRQRRARDVEQQQLKQQAHEQKVQKRVERAERQQAEKAEATEQ